MADLHLRLLRQAARLRRRQLQDARAADTSPGTEVRLREAEDARTRADAQLAAASARRRLDGELP
jgi:hypothetical protein